MRKILLPAILALLLPMAARADVLFPNLGAAAAVSATDILACYQGAEPVLGCTAAQLKTFFSASPTLVTPNLGTPSAGTLTNATGLPISTGVSGLGTGIATALGLNVGSAGAPVLFNGAGGTPSSLTLTNGTGLPLTTGVTGVLAGTNGGTGVNNGSNTLTLGGSASLPAAPASTQCLHMANTGAITATGSDCGAGGSVSVTASTSNVVINPSPGTGTFTVGTTAATNDQHTAGYTVLAGDNTKTILIGAFTYALPQAGSAGFAAGWATCFLNIGSGAATINTTTSTFLGAGGGTSLTVPVGASVCAGSDGTNWDTPTAPGGFAGTSGHTLPYLDGTNTWSGTQTFGTTVGSINTQSGTSYTLAASDCGKTILFTSASAITLTTLNSLPAGCSIAVEQSGAGQVTVTAGTGATQHSAHSFTKTSGQFAVIGLFVDTNSGGSAADYIITGDGA